MEVNSWTFYAHVVRTYEELYTHDLRNNFLSKFNFITDGHIERMIEMLKKMLNRPNGNSMGDILKASAVLKAITVWNTLDISRSWFEIGEDEDTVTVRAFGDDDDDDDDDGGLYNHELEIKFVLSEGYTFKALAIKHLISPSNSDDWEGLEWLEPWFLEDEDEDEANRMFQFLKIETKVHDGEIKVSVTAEGSEEGYEGFVSITKDLTEEQKKDPKIQDFLKDDDRLLKYVMSSTAPLALLSEVRDPRMRSLLA